MGIEILALGRYYTLFRVILILSLLLVSCQNVPQEKPQKLRQEQANEKAEFWHDQNKGTNYFNHLPTQEWFDAAKAAGIKLIRLTYEKWQGQEKDFLLGNADDYKAIVESDFQTLKYYLDYADQLDLKVVITPISLPGARWIQMNNNVRDLRLWKDFKYHKQVISFWRDLASRLKDHPAVVGYNIVNEPHPEKAYDKHSFWDGELSNWYQGVKDGPGDLNLFYETVIESIRTVDSKTPIIIESGLYGTPWAFEYLRPVEEDNIIYSFHMYEPYEFSTKRINQGRFSYPSRILIDGHVDTFQLDRTGLREFLKPISDWSEKHKVPSNRIWVGEFGCNRHIEGVEGYLSDLISIFNEYNWHWSFYAYREDTWEAMDYELGTEKVFYKYWEYQENKNLHLHYDEIYDKVKDKNLWSVFEEELN